MDKCRASEDLAAHTMDISLEIESTVCCVCKHDCGEIAEECFIANTCPDCCDVDCLEELLDGVL